MGIMDDTIHSSIKKKKILMKKQQFILSFICVLSLGACVISRYHDDFWDPTLILKLQDFKVNRNGYFKLINPPPINKYDGFRDFILYENGFFAGHGFRVSQDRMQKAEFKTPQVDWGIYNIGKDSVIIIQHFYPAVIIPGFFSAIDEYAVSSVKGYVSDAGTILIYSRTEHVLRPKKTDEKISHLTFQPPLEFKFIGHDSLPSSDGNWLEEWLKKKKEY